MPFGISSTMSGELQTPDQQNPNLSHITICDLISG